MEGKDLLFTCGHGIIVLHTQGAHAQWKGDAMEITDELTAVVEEMRKKTGTKVLFEEPSYPATKFTLHFGNKDYAAWIRGKGEESRLRARLVQYLVGKTAAEPVIDRMAELRRIVYGEGGAWGAIRFLTNFAIPDGKCFCLVIVPERLFDEAFTHVERCLTEARGDAVFVTDDGRIAVVRFSDDDQSAYDFGSFIAQSLYEEAGVRARIGVGCEMRSFTEIATSFMQAATAFRMTEILREKGAVHSYREYLLVRVLEDIPRSRLVDYMDQFRIAGAADVFEDAEMTSTAEAFLENSLNISETSRTLFMHRNTLTYRLDKIERTTGLNIRKFSDAVTFRILTVLYKLIQT